MTATLVDAPSGFAVGCVASDSDAAAARRTEDRRHLSCLSEESRGAIPPPDNLTAPERCNDIASLRLHRENRSNVLVSH